MFEFFSGIKKGGRTMVRGDNNQGHLSGMKFIQSGSVDKGKIE